MAGKTRRSAKVAKFSAEEQAKYKEIAEAVSAKKKDKTVDPKAAVEKIEASLAKFAEVSKPTYDDALNPSDPEFVGIVICGEVVSGGELKVDLDDVFVEEPREEEEKEEEPEWASPEERRAAFVELLQEKGVKPTMKWEEALKLVQEDRRFNALNTAGERKQCFAEFVTQTKKRAKEEEREKRKRAKDDFIAALSDWEDLRVTSRYKEAAEAFCDKEFFKLIEEDERDELFQDFLDEHEKKIREDRRKKRKEYVEKVKTVYAENEEISVLSRWRDVQDILRDNETYKWLSKLEALTSWEEWIQETEKKELESKSKGKFRTERKTRDAFKQLLKDNQEKGAIKMTTHWRDLSQTIQDEPGYLNLLPQSGATPHDLFDDFIDELNERYKEDRAKIKKWGKAKGLVVTSTSTAEWFHEQLQGEEGFLQIPEEHRRLVFDSLVTKAKEQDEDVEKNAKKNRKKFVELLQKTREVTASTTYDMAVKILGSSPAWEAVDEQTRRQCFDIFVDQLKIQSESRRNADGGDDGPSGESDGDGERRKKDKKKEKEKGKKKKHEEIADKAYDEEPVKTKKHKKK
mmetsp:Transcript_57049/g.137918  ORF Transcript_57049/g.137918 Transcript_57049/m.137918 type:complete len:573 (+) Transcript_57049:92-1810(+)